MFDVGISGHSTSTEDDESTTCNKYVIRHYTQFSIAVASFIYGVASWCLIRKFRNFNNYVYISAILVNIFRLTVVSIADVPCDKWFHSRMYLFIFVYLTNVFNYWVLVMCYMFYVDIVKVFHQDIERKFLKSSVFAWGLPLFVLGLCRLVLLIVEMSLEDDDEKVIMFYIELAFIGACTLIPLILNFIFFIQLVYSLFFCEHKNKTVVPRNETVKEKLSRLCTATTMFIVTNFNVMTLAVWELLDFSFPLRAYTLSIQIIALALFVPLIKSNRALWSEYYKNRLKGFCRDYLGCKE